MKKPSARTRQTRLRILRAFNALILERGYAKLTVRDVIESAGVGRSTFYEHFETKDDILRASLQPLFSIFADAVIKTDMTLDLRDMIAHFWENRRLARVTFSGPTRPIASRTLAALIEERLAARSGDPARSKAAVPRALVAAMIAESQLGVIVAWCSGVAAAPPEAVARLIHASAHKLAAL